MLPRKSRWKQPQGWNDQAWRIFVASCRARKAKEEADKLAKHPEDCECLVCRTVQKYRSKLINEDAV